MDDINAIWKQLQQAKSSEIIPGYNPSAVQSTEGPGWREQSQKWLEKNLKVSPRTAGNLTGGPDGELSGAGLADIPNTTGTAAAFADWKQDPSYMNSLNLTAAAIPVVGPAIKGAAKGATKLWHGTKDSFAVEPLIKEGFQRGASAELNLPGTSISRDPSVSLRGEFANEDLNKLLSVKVEDLNIRHLKPHEYLLADYKDYPQKYDALGKPNQAFSEDEIFLTERGRSKAQPQKPTDRELDISSRGLQLAHKADTEVNRLRKYNNSIDKLIEEDKYLSPVTFSKIYNSFTPSIQSILALKSTGGRGEFEKFVKDVQDGMISYTRVEDWFNRYVEKRATSGLPFTEKEKHFARFLNTAKDLKEVKVELNALAEDLLKIKNSAKAPETTRYYQTANPDEQTRYVNEIAHKKQTFDDAYRMYQTTKNNLVKEMELFTGTKAVTPNSSKAAIEQTENSIADDFMNTFHNYDNKAQAVYDTFIKYNTDFVNKKISQEEYKIAQKEYNKYYKMAVEAKDYTLQNDFNWAYEQSIKNKDAGELESMLETYIGKEDAGNLPTELAEKYGDVYTKYMKMFKEAAAGGFLTKGVDNTPVSEDFIKTAEEEFSKLYNSKNFGINPLNDLIDLYYDYYKDGLITTEEYNKVHSIWKKYNSKY